MKAYYIEKAKKINQNIDLIMKLQEYERILSSSEEDLSYYSSINDSFMKKCELETIQKTKKLINQIQSSLSEEDKKFSSLNQVYFQPGEGGRDMIIITKK